MSDGTLFKDTSVWMDTVDLALCLFIYEVCISSGISLARTS